jgi:hypothetical protein
MEHSDFEPILLFFDVGLFCDGLLNSSNEWYSAPESYYFTSHIEPNTPQIWHFHLSGSKTTQSSFEMRFHIDNSAFVNMVDSRWFKPGSDLLVKMLAVGRSSIRSVVLKFTQQEVDTDIYHPLRALDAEALRVVVVTGTNGIQV